LDDVDTRVHHLKAFGRAWRRSAWTSCESPRAMNRSPIKRAAFCHPTLFATFRNVSDASDERVAHRRNQRASSCTANANHSGRLPGGAQEHKRRLAMSRKSTLVYATLTAYALSTLLSSTASAAHFGGRGGFGSRQSVASFHRSVASFQRPAATFHQPIGGMKKFEPIAGTKKIEHRRDGAQPPLGGGLTGTVPGRNNHTPPWGSGCEACPPHHTGPTAPILQALPGRNLASAGGPVELFEVPSWMGWAALAVSPGAFLLNAGIRSVVNNVKNNGNPLPFAGSGGGGGGGNLDSGTPITAQAAQQMSGGGGSTDQPSGDAGAHTDSGETGTVDTAKTDGGA
jgi:hypothetical protein